MKMLYIYTMEFQSAIKKNEVIKCTGEWVKPENIALREVMEL